MQYLQRPTLATKHKEADSDPWVNYWPAEMQTGQLEFLTLSKAHTQVHEGQVRG
jgi:hypothetical protein